MKYSIAVLITLIACFSTNILAKPTFESDAGFVVKKAYNVGSLEFIVKCLSKGKFGIIKLAWNRLYNDQLPYDVADDMVKESKKLKVNSENGWKKVINNKCLKQDYLIEQNKKDVDTINVCFDKKNQLEGAKKDEFAYALLESFCSAVRILAMEKLAAETKG